ncbi:MAG: Calx-beta domain-containing protein [Ilumatobacter sp.]|uniref:Calx-beta domain-containing protein n=2 Tax=Ilumatobacter sp. TaxID=1967498 RepID=UPI003296C101
MSVLRPLAVFLFVTVGVSIAPIAEPIASAAPVCTTTWVGPTTGVTPLTTPSSWSTGVAPTPADVVCFRSNTAIRVLGATLTVAGWDITAGGSVRLENGSNVTVTGEADLGGLTLANSRVVLGADAYVESGETLVAAANPANIEATESGPTLTVREGGRFTVDAIARAGVDIVNQGTVTVNGRFARIGMRPGTSLSNSGTLALNGPTTINAEPGSPAPTARNEPGGTVLVDGPAFVPLSVGGIGDAAQFLGIGYTNDGTMHVRSGQGALGSGGTHNGTFRVDADAQLGISAPSNVFGPDSVVAGGGTVRVSVFGVLSDTTSVTVDAAAAFEPAELHLMTGRMVVDGDRTLPLVRIAGGAVLDVRSDTVVGGGLLAVQPGQSAVLAGTGSVTIPEGSAMTLSGGNALFLRDSVRLVNDGEIRQDGPTIGVEGSARITNRASWTITQSADVRLGSSTVLRNEGRMTIDGPGDAQLGFSGTLDNVGEIDVGSGRVDFRSTSVAQHVDGTLAGGSWTLAEGTTWLGFPSIRTIDGATVALRGDARLLRFNGGETTAFDDLERIGPTGRLDLLDGATLDTSRLAVNGLRVDGVLSLSKGATVTTDSLAVGIDAGIRLELGETSPGSVAVSGVADLDGAIVATQGPDAIVEATYPFVTSSSIVGAFAGVSGPGDPPVTVRRVDSTIELVIGEAPAPPLPTASLAGAVVDEGSSSDPASVRIVLDEPAGVDGVTVDYETFDPGDAFITAARPGVDFEPVTAGRVTIPPGGTEAALAAVVLDDDIHEQPERRSVGVRVTGGATIEVEAQGLLTILDDDPRPLLSMDDAVFTESDADGEFTLPLTGVGVTDRDRCLTAFVFSPDQGTITGDVVADGGGSIGEFSIPAGATAVDIGVTVVGDDVAESTESFEVRITDGCPAAGDDPVVATATIEIVDDDDDLLGSITPSTLTIDEGTAATFTLELVDVAPADRTVRLVLSPPFFGSVADADDFDPLAADGVFVVPAGASVVSLPTLTARADGRYERTQSTFVDVLDGNALVARARLDVADTDPRPTIAVVDPRLIDGTADIREGTSSLAGVRDYTVDLALNIPTEVPLTFVLGLSRGTATSPYDSTSNVDFTIPTDVVYSVPPGDGRTSITIGIVEDGRAEADETFVLVPDLLQPDPESASVTYTIIDDDPRLRLEEFSRVDEGATLPVMLDIGSPTDVDRTFEVRLLESDASVPGLDLDLDAEPDDYVDTGGEFVVPAGVTEIELASIIAVADDIDEPVQRFDYVVLDEQRALVDLRRIEIRDTNPIPTVTITGTTKFTEGSRGVTRTEVITARLNGVSVFDVTYPVTIKGDVIPNLPSSFRFPPGVTEATLTVGIVEDTLVESDQSFTIEATLPETRPVDTATFTIEDDDVEDRPLPIITEARVEPVLPPGQGTLPPTPIDNIVTIELTNPTGQAIALDGLRLAAAPPTLFDSAATAELAVGGTLGPDESRVVSVVVRGPASGRVTNGVLEPSGLWWIHVDRPNTAAFAATFPVRFGIGIEGVERQTRMRSGMRDQPAESIGACVMPACGVFTGVYDVRLGAAMGSHRFDPDTSGPTIAVPPSISVATTSNQATVRVSYPFPAQSDDSEMLFLLRPQCTPRSGSSFPMNATTVVRCTSEDIYGNVSSASFPVIVNRINAIDPGITPAGQVIPISGGGFVPGGRVRIVLRSEPIELGDVTADGSGRVSRTVTLPADTAPGSHTITLEGIAPDGTSRLVVHEIEVGRPCTITGSPRADLIVGTNGSDVICSGNGDDIVFALGGDDLVFGGAGSDILLGGVGDDHVDGGTGRDLVVGGAGRDTLIGEVRVQ